MEGGPNPNPLTLTLTPDCCYWMHCWSEEHSMETWRAYNYPHVCTVYWSLYRLARHYSPPLTKRADWRFYLEQACRPTGARTCMHAHAHSRVLAIDRC